MTARPSWAVVAASGGRSIPAELRGEPGRFGRLRWQPDLATFRWEDPAPRSVWSCGRRLPCPRFVGLEDVLPEPSGVLAALEAAAEDAFLREDRRGMAQVLRALREYQAARAADPESFAGGNPPSPRAARATCDNFRTRAQYMARPERPQETVQ